jgi:hypothetical protein
MTGFVALEVGLLRGDPPEFLRGPWDEPTAGTSLVAGILIGTGATAAAGLMISCEC